MADAPVLGAGSPECGFKSHLPHQTNIIRTSSSLWGTGSDYLLFRAIRKHLFPERRDKAP